MSIDTLFEEFRVQCLVRWAIAYGIKSGASALNLWLDGYEKKSGDLSLRALAEQQWTLGNRGRKGQWIAAEEPANG